LADRFWQAYLEADPIDATVRGDHRHDGLIPDLSEAARRKRLRDWRELRDEVAATRPQSLVATDQITRTMLLERLEELLAEELCHLESWQVDSRNGWPVVLLSLGTLQPQSNGEEAAALLARWRRMPELLLAYRDNLREGLGKGWTAARAEVDRVLRQLDALLDTPDKDWPLASPAQRAPAGAPPDFAAEVVRVVGRDIRPAFVALRAFLRNELLPAARDDAHAGLFALPFGAACYASLIATHTSLDKSPRELHRLGLEEIENVRGEVTRLAQGLFRTTEWTQIQEIVRRRKPAESFATRQEVLAAAEAAVRRAREALPKAFKTLPRQQCEVRPIEPQEERDAPDAYYREPSADGRRAGIYYVNTYEPATRPRYESEVLAFHEALPGHHLQIALAAEMRDLPAFRRQLGVTAFVEGWALYAERLADELNLYGSPERRLGMLAFDAWRAGRLVVDTGLHAFGWSRTKAVTYLLENTLATRENIENEVDRYITWPGQALAYKVGQREILRLRADAKRALGASFDIRDFHAVVLGQGAVSLPVLEDVVNNWILTSRREAARRAEAMPTDSDDQGGAERGAEQGLEDSADRDARQPRPPADAAPSSKRDASTD